MLLHAGQQSIDLLPTGSTAANLQQRVHAATNIWSDTQNADTVPLQRPWGRMHDAGVRVSPGLKSTYDGLATTPVCMTPT